MRSVAIRRDCGVDEPNRTSCGFQRTLQTVPDMGADLWRIARLREDFGERGYACACRASLTEAGCRNVAIVNSWICKSESHPPFAKTRRRMGHPGRSNDVEQRLRSHPGQSRPA